MLCKVIHFSDNKRFCPQLFVAAHHFIHEKEPADDGMLFFLRMNEQHLSAVALWPDGEMYPVASTLVPLYQQLHFIFSFVRLSGCQERCPKG